MTTRFALKQDLVLVGAGGHGRVLMAAIELLDGWIIGVSDFKLQAGSATPAGHPVLQDAEIVQRCPPDQVLLVNGVGSVGVPEARNDVFVRWRARGYRFATIVHPAAVVAPSADLGEGAQVMAGAVIQNDVHIGDNSLVNTRASVDHDCNIGDSVHLAPGVTLSGGVGIGDLSHVGTGASIIQGVRIGRRSMIGAGAVIVGDVPEGGRIAPGAVAGERKETVR
jgi:sugar O-acyltransferase (sialic acid O-acetyltransferase NeuD family)